MYPQVWIRDSDRSPPIGTMPRSDTHSDYSATTDLLRTWREERTDSDADGGGYRARCRRDETIGTVIALTVAVARDTRPTDLPPLASVVDADGLSRLISTGTGKTMTTFPYADCTVTVRSSGEVVVVPETADPRE